MDRAVTAPPSLERLGVRPVINASGIYTDLGGSRLSPAVWSAMTESNRSFVRMADLLESSGAVIAARLGVEAARVTPGAAASIALMTAAAMTGTDGAAGQRLPDTAGLRNEIVLQRNHRYKYDRQITMTGAKLVLAGGEAGTSVAELEAAIGPATAALFVPAHLDGQGNTVRLDPLILLARRHRIPVLLDAAYLCWPLEALTRYAASGADLVCFSAKYFGGPNAGGFIAGSRSMIDAVMANNFVAYESGPYRRFGRPLKMDRQIVVGVVAALEEWLAMDHGARWERYSRQADRLRAMLDGVPGLRATRQCFTMEERLVPEPVNALVVELPGHARPIGEVAGALAAGDPSIACVALEDRLVFCFDVTEDQEIEAIGRRLREILGSR